MTVPEITGYVCGDYLRVSDAATGGMTMDENTLKLLLSAMIQSGRPNGSGTLALTPDGNLTLRMTWGPCSALENSSSPYRPNPAITSI